MGEERETRVVVMGAGPAGLSAADELGRHGVACTVLEKDPATVGGIARTVEHLGCRFDVGPHRFFSKSELIEQRWQEWLGDDFVECDRLTRILYRGRYFDYPIKPANALLGLGPLETVRCMGSYGLAKLAPVREPRSFEDWVSNQFGRRLFSIFFKTYTEKVWGIPTSELSADWAAQRIKGLNLFEAVRSALLPRSGGRDGKVIKTLIDRFHFPRRGAGQMWEKVAELQLAKGTPIEMGAEVVRVNHDGGRATSVEARTAGGVRTWRAEHFVSSLPIRELVASFSPRPPAAVLDAAASLKYRDFLTVDLVVRRGDVCPDNWIYVHDPGVRVARISNFKRFSRDMVPDDRTTGLGLEYFCFEGDGIWESSDEELVALGTREVAQLGLANPDEVAGGKVHRQAKTYPVYDDEYLTHLRVIRDYVAAELPNLQFVGRNGMHRYNNQDHSMMTGILAAQNIALGESFDLWKVNGDAEYLEEVREDDDSGRQTPARVGAGAA